MQPPSDDSAWASPHTRAQVPPVPTPPEPEAPRQPVRRELDPFFSRGLSRRTVVLAVAAILVVVTVCAVVTALGSRPTPAGQAGAPEPSASPTPYFQAPNDLCQEADFTNLRPTFNTLGDLSADRQDGAGGTVITKCDGSTGNDTVQGAFTFVTMVTPTDAAARRLFDDERATIRSWTSTTDVAGLGTAAYSYVEPGGGVSVHAYQANLTIRLTWVPERASDPVPDGTAGALAATCRSTMALFHG